jgi:hypothetical protein
MKYANIREEELKIQVGIDYFKGYDCAKKIGNVDFCVRPQRPVGDFFTHDESLLWAEAKTGDSDIYNSIVQLILTIGKARTFDKILPPPMLGAFDGEKIAFIPYSEVNEIFYQNDFNWNVTPSDHSTKEFKLVHSRVKGAIDSGALLFHFDKDEKDLKEYIKINFVVGKNDPTKIRIDKNNFMVVYNKWLQTVKPTIAVNWDLAKKTGIIDGDFYLADLLSSENQSIKEKLFVILNHNRYELDRRIDEAGLDNSKTTGFKDGQTAHKQFWNRYDRPPKEEYWDYIIGRRDLLVPQDVRERKGSFFTPQIWVELSQKYLADALGDDWQDEYTIWDCAAGTGNLLNGLTNKYNIWASTLDQQDVDVMRDRIHNGANLLPAHVFQFDFLNDDFSKLPAGLQEIINDPKKRKKLIIYINPPYAEATSSKTVTGTAKNKDKVATHNKINEEMRNKIGNASNEVFALFMARIYNQIPDAILGQFSTMKFVSGANFAKFKEYFLAKFLSGFIVPSYTFDNVNGDFPIGFTLWNLGAKEKIKTVICDVFDEEVENIGEKTFDGDIPQSINKWLVNFYQEASDSDIGVLSTRGNDFQNQKYIYIATKIDNKVHDTKVKLGQFNLIQVSIYFAVRHAMDATWLNDRDQFLQPNGGWKSDLEFQNNCFMYTLFSGQNKVSSKDGVNHWIPFTEVEVKAREKFDSNFMTKFISGKLKSDAPSQPDLLGAKEHRTTPLTFSPQAQAVFDEGRALYTYYHQQPNCNVNASLYDIREHFQGRNAAGRMNNASEDAEYSLLIKNLRDRLKALQKAIEPKIYAYEFLK